MALRRRKQEEPTIYAELEHNPTPEEENLIQWRTDILERAGCLHTTAKKIAKRLHIDLHEAEKLKQNGCDDDLLLRICR